MKKQLNFTLIILLLSCSFSIHAQKENLIGFWEIENVEVGEENMTPVAKWTKINADGTYQSGNGWLQNSKGTWNYDNENNKYSATDSLDIFDEFGGFIVSFDQKKMFWEREEEGMQVKVTLGPIHELPMATSDYLEGMWQLVDMSEKGQSILEDFENAQEHKLFIRWDRMYMKFSPEGKKLTGYWHINGHKPEITLLPHQADENVESWRVEVNKKELIMTGISDSNKMIERKYIRKNTF